MATLILICGLPGSGKSTLARRLEAEKGALRLTPDEWVGPLYGEDLDEEAMDACRTPIETVQWAVASRALELGLDVILENGSWSRAERDEYQAKARQLGASVELCYLDVPLDELWVRIERRNADLPPHTFPITKEQLNLWASWFEPPSADELNRQD